MNPFRSPHYIPVPKISTNATAMKFHCYGIINHSVNKRYINIIPALYAQGPNMICSILLDHIMHTLSFAKDSQRSRNLTIQVDNCWKENKNKWVLAFAALLVHWKIYDQVQVSSLVPGHTHEDIDQMFSNFYKYYYRHSLCSLLNLQDFITNAYTSAQTRPSIRFPRMYNFKDVMQNLISNFKGHSTGRFFRFMRYPEYDNEVRMTYKSSSQEEWQDVSIVDSNNIHVAYMPMKVLQNPPKFQEFIDSLPIIEPNPLDSNLSLFVEKYKPYMTNNDFNWWQAFIENPDILDEDNR